MPLLRIGSRPVDARTRFGAFALLLAVAALIAGGQWVAAQTPRSQPPKTAQPSGQAAAGQPAASQPATSPAAASENGEKVESEEEVDDGHPLRPALKLAYASRMALKEVKDYSALFVKKERVGNRQIKQSMRMKVRENPFSVYLNFQGPEAGREVIYPAPKNRNNLLVHAEGIKAIAGTVSLPLTSPEITSENRYPISNIGVSHLLDVIITQWEAETKFGETKVQLFPNAKLGELPCTVIESSHPQARKQFKFHMTRLYLDKQTNLPIRAEQYAWPRAPGETAPLIEEYTYSNLKTNIGLTDQDFDPRNPNYHF